jgi:DNA-binding CsgD family transcriptional regulator
MGLLVLGHSGNILAANRMARLAIDKGGAIRERDGIVTLRPAGDNNRLQELIHSARDGNGSPTAIPIPRRRGKPFLLLFVPLRDGLMRESADGPLALLIMNGVPRKAKCVLLSEFFRFTWAESNLASLLMQGKTVQDLAKALDISESTTRNHLKHMYTKTGTSKQIELLHMLLTSPASLLVSLAREKPGEPAVLQRAHAATSR